MTTCDLCGEPITVERELCKRCELEETVPLAEHVGEGN